MFLGLRNRTGAGALAQPGGALTGLVDGIRSLLDAREQRVDNDAQRKHDRWEMQQKIQAKARNETLKDDDTGELVDKWVKDQIITGHDNRPVPRLDPVTRLPMTGPDGGIIYDDRRMPYARDEAEMMTKAAEMGVNPATWRWLDDAEQQLAVQRMDLFNDSAAIPPMIQMDDETAVVGGEGPVMTPDFLGPVPSEGPALPDLPPPTTTPAPPEVPERTWAEFFGLGGGEDQPAQAPEPAPGSAMPVATPAPAGIQLGRSGEVTVREAPAPEPTAPGMSLATRMFDGTPASTQEVAQRQVSESANQMTRRVTDKGGDPGMAIADMIATAKNAGVYQPVEGLPDEVWAHFKMGTSGIPFNDPEQIRQLLYGTDEEANAVLESMNLSEMDESVLQETLLRMQAAGLIDVGM